jgi:hypothetical protein
MITLFLCAIYFTICIQVAFTMPQNFMRYLNIDSYLRICLGSEIFILCLTALDRKNFSPEKIKLPRYTCMLSLKLLNYWTDCNAIWCERDDIRGYQSCTS